MDLIDLHIHTTASDGSRTPKEVVKLADDAGLKTIAITDHDTIDGLDEALKQAESLEIEVITGVEISVDAGFKGGMHMLGYCIDHHEPNLAEGLKTLQQARAKRNPQMVKKLNQIGLQITMEQVASFAGDGQIGRPHFAQALIEKGYVKNRSEAFNRYLAAGKPGYIPKYKFTPEKAMKLLRQAGGVPVVAHPGLLRLPFGQLESLIRSLQEKGLGGIEALYSEHDTALRKRLVSLAGRLQLAVTGGSDYHGDPKPDIKLGYGLGDLRVPYELVPALKIMAAKIKN